MSENKHTPGQITALSDQFICHPASRSIDEIEMAGEIMRDLLKQRDELLAALGSGGRHCNDDTPHSDLCEAIIDSKEADLGQGLDPFWKWAFRRGFHEAETSYKVDIATLEQQRDELLAELQRFMDSHEECTDFDGFTAQIVSMADYHQAQEAIASVKGGA